jgi:hypothetical protein
VVEPSVGEVLSVLKIEHGLRIKLASCRLRDWKHVGLERVENAGKLLKSKYGIKVIGG